MSEPTRDRLSFLHPIQRIRPRAALTIAVCAIAIGSVATACSSSTHSSGDQPTVTSSAPSTSAAAPSSSVSAPAAAGASVSFNGVSVGHAGNLATAPVVTAKSTKTPAALQIKDLVVGSGKAATPTSTVTVQYTGVLYANGTKFDSSWDRGQPTSFPLTGVVPGFTQGIGGTSTVPAMKVGGRRIMILPASLGYGASGTPDGSIPPNAPIVFVVDLLAVQ